MIATVMSPPIIPASDDRLLEGLATELSVGSSSCRYYIRYWCIHCHVCMGVYVQQILHTKIA